MKGNRGNIVNLAAFVVVAFVMALLLGVFIYLFSVMDSAITGADIVTDAGVNISNMSSSTFGNVSSGYINNADLIGILFLFGTALSVMLIGFLNRDKTPPIFFIIEIIALILIYIVSVYISNAYETVLTELPFISLIAENLSITSNIVLNLPILTIVVGVITMILTYSAIPKRGEEASVAGI